MASSYDAHIYVTLKRGVLDPQGDTVRSALAALGFAEVQDLRIGKFMILRVEQGSREAAEARVHEMCRRLLANPVIEEYRFDLHEAARGAEATAR